MINGSCHPEEKCKMCIDSDIVRYENESWNRNKCTKCSCKGKLYFKVWFKWWYLCFKDGQILCNTMTCGVKTCGVGFKVKTVENGGSDQCCPTQVCVPLASQCGNIVKPTCGPYQEISEVKEINGCPRFVCGKHLT